MLRDDISSVYFDWLCEIVEDIDRPEGLTFRKLLTQLHETRFLYSISKDSNRAEDGKTLRYRFAYCNPRYRNAETYLRGPCSILEMMIALAIRCEEIMDVPSKGDRTSQWFWGMIVNLGLGSMVDSRYDSQYVGMVLEKFNRRDYEASGKGGLFTIRNCDYDLRDVEIWYQLNWFLDTIT